MQLLGIKDKNPLVSLAIPKSPPFLNGLSPLSPQRGAPLCPPLTAHNGMYHLLSFWVTGVARPLAGDFRQVLDQALHLREEKWQI